MGKIEQEERETTIPEPRCGNCHWRTCWKICERMPGEVHVSPYEGPCQYHMTMSRAIDLGAFMGIQRPEPNEQ